MAKDLRNLLEPANKGASSGANTAPLAQRRNLLSPGEPRVFQVKSGFVCGLCGRVHSKLEPAFDCLGRCTIELRLRSPSGRTSGEAPSHHACTACGRGFANADDAEECFERCLVRMKPNPQFEAALRRVQIRYVQRLQAHGVRPLQRIDPFAEHTKMLTTLTREQQAMGRRVVRPGKSARLDAHAKPLEKGFEFANFENLALPDAPPGEASASAHEASSETSTLEAAEAVKESETSETSTTSMASPAVQADLSAEMAESHSDSEIKQNSPDEFAVKPSTSIDAPQSIEEMELENDLMAGHDVQDDTGESSNLQNIGLDATTNDSDASANLNNLLGGGDMSADADADVLIPTNLHDTLSQANSLDLSPSESGLENLLEAPKMVAPKNDSTQSGSALSLLAKANKANMLASTEFAQPIATAETILDDFKSNFGNETSDNLSNAFAEASDFANVAEQPETNLIAADVLALLQTNESKTDVDPSANENNILKDKIVKIDEGLLDAVSEAIDESAGTTIFLRKADMKPYRRNNAKYCCSACSTEFFTKEQVEACFYTHPEEGSEEAGALLAKVRNNSKKSAA